MSQQKHLSLRYFSESLTVVVGLVLIWRGTWYILDAIDRIFFNNNHEWTALVGVVLGLVILYLPDHDLKELRKL